MIMAPVGKSGPGMCSMSSGSSMSGLSMTAHMPSTTSRMLWGGMFVAIPTAIPMDPLTRRFGYREGRTVGSFRRSS